MLSHKSRSLIRTTRDTKRGSLWGRLKEQLKECGHKAGLVQWIILIISLFNQ